MCILLVIMDTLLFLFPKSIEEESQKKTFTVLFLLIVSFKAGNNFDRFSLRKHNIVKIYFSAC